MKQVMKSILLSAGILLTGLSTATAGGNDNSYKVVKEKSELTWHAKKVTGAHFGSVKVKDGLLTGDGKTLNGGKFEIDMTSITVEDLKDAEYNGKLLGHLKSDDFFSVDKFSTAVLEIQSSKLLSGDQYEVTGVLTIKGISNPITFPATIKMSDKSVVAVAQVTVDRTKYDIKYGSASFFEGIGDKAIEDTFRMDVKVSAQK
jgi:polyisoprenoid-binding protein YceI